MAVAMPITPAAFVSPSAAPRRHLATSSSKKSPRGQNNLMSPLAMNDDQAERSERQMSRILEMQQHHLVSPGTGRTDRRQSLSLGGLTNAQLTEHYADCIKLSAENRISAKNAFGLHLIDYMMDLVKKKDVTDFQMASSTLDASTKIYAGRVDAVHTEMYKVLSGLGRGSTNNQKQDETREGDGDMGGENDMEGEGGRGLAEGGEDEANKTRKRAKRSKTIETNLKNITVNNFDLEFEVEAISLTNLSAFDDGGTSGLLLNNLHCFDESCQHVLDSSTAVPTGENKSVVTSSSAVISGADLQLLKECFDGYKSLDKLKICPAFETFEFNNWNAEEAESLKQAIEKLGKANEHEFDMNAEPESIGGEDCGGAPDYIDDEDDFGMVHDDEEGAHYDANDSGDSGRGSGAELVGLSRNARQSQNAAVIENTIMSVKNGELGNLIKVLASEPTDYSYFSSDLLKTWVGPEHWKLKSRVKGDGLTTTEGEKKGSKSKSNKSKQTFSINFSDEIDIDAVLRCTRAATTVAKAKLEKNCKIETKLPDDLHYEGKQLLQTFEMSSVMVKWQTNEDAPRIEVERYNYDNENDRCNFCPESQKENDDDDNDDCGYDNYGLPADGDDDDDGVGCGMDFNLTSGDNTAHSNTMLADGTMLTGDNLLAPPRKIAKIEIDYAKEAKRVDVKRLKGAMWDILAVQNPDKSTLNESNAGAQSINSSRSCNDTEFHSLVDELAQRVSTNVLRNLSIPIVFVCLLHLANEKTLDIKSSEDLCDMIIKQG